VKTQLDESRAIRAVPRATKSQHPQPHGGLAALAIHALNRIAEQHAQRGLAEETSAIDLAPKVTALARALAVPDDPLAETMVADLLASGLSVRRLCAEYLAPAARELGGWWETDEMGFADVTLATTRIQEMLRRLPRSRKKGTIKDGRGALFAAVPGEDHTLGLLMAADYFRRLNWDVGLLIGMDQAETRARIIDDDRTVLGLSCTSANAVDNLRRLVIDLRHRRPDLAIVVSGGIAHDAEKLRTLPAFDGVVTRLEGADRILRTAERTVRTQRASI